MRRVIGVISNSLRASYRDRITMSAAGVAFFVLLALFPGIAAILGLYGMFADAGQTDSLLTLLPDILPAQVAELIARQTKRIANQQTAPTRSNFLAPLLGIGLLLVSATKGLGSLFNTLNGMREASEKRGFFQLVGISLAFTVGLILTLLLTVGIVFILPYVVGVSRLGDIAWFVTLLRWPVLLLVLSFFLTLVYHFGSNHPARKWRWLTAGSVVATLLWMLCSALFEWIVARYGNFDELYGSLSAVIGFMIWVWLSVIVVLFGAELDATLEAESRPSD